MNVRQTVWFAALPFVFAPVLLAAQPGPNPYQIFANARAYWLHQRYPAALGYTIAVEVSQGGKSKIERYTASYNAENNTIYVDPTSDYELKHPVVPKGADINLVFWSSKPLPAIDFIGVPKLSPAYTFGMAPFVPAPTPTPFNSMALVNEIRKEFHDPNPRKTPTPPPTPTPLPEIAVVVARTHDYHIRLLGTETISGHPCYHLALTPTHDPWRYRIREAWIDETTYATWQLKDSMNFTSGVGAGVAWTIHFTDAGGAHYIAEEDADAPISASGEIYTRTTLRFEHIVAAPESMPAGFGLEPRNIITEP